MIWRWVGCVLALSVLLTSGSVLIARGTASDDPGCLIFSDHVYDAGQLDLRTGVAMNVTTIPARLERAAAQIGKNLSQFGQSLDQKHFAYSVYDAQTSQSQLFIKSTEHPGFGAQVLVQALFGKPALSLNSDPPDFGWSLDGQWLAYWWQTANKQNFLGIADADGHVQHIVPISIPISKQTKVMLTGYSGFSADDAYLSLTVTDDQTSVKNLLFWSVPDMRLIQTVQFMSPSQSNNGNFFEIWSQKGHQIAYWLIDDATKELELGLITPGEKPYYFHFPNANRLSPDAFNHLVGPGWSPDGRYLFAEYDVTSGQNSLVAWSRLALVDSVTKIVQPLNDHVMGPPLYGTFWSDDGRLLYYQQANDKLQFDRQDLMVFRIASDRSELLAPTLDPNFFDYISQNVLLFSQSSADSNNIVALWKDSAKIKLFSGIQNGATPVYDTTAWFSGNEWAVFVDTFRTGLSVINVRTGVQTHYYESALGDTISNLSFSKGWFSGIKLGPPPLLQLVRLTDGVERDIPLPYDSITLLPDTTVWSGDGAYVAVVSRDQAYPDAPFTADVVRVADGHVQHIRNVSPIFNSIDSTLASISFGKCG